MRTNKFGEKYYTTADEVRRKLDDHENGWEVYVSQIGEPEGEIGATAEIVENGSGDLVCYVEAPTVDAVKAIITELKLEIQ